MYIVYYVSFKMGPGAVYSRCFNSEAERKNFISRVDLKGADIRTWEKECRN